MIHYNLLSCIELAVNQSYDHDCQLEFGSCWGLFMPIAVFDVKEIKLTPSQIWILLLIRMIVVVIIENKVFSGQDLK